MSIIPEIFIQLGRILKKKGKIEDRVLNVCSASGKQPTDAVSDISVMRGKYQGVVTQFKDSVFDFALFL